MTSAPVGQVELVDDPAPDVLVTASTGSHGTQNLMRAALEEIYLEAASAVDADASATLLAPLATLGLQDLAEATDRVGRAKHAGRGALLTLLIYKNVNPQQDIRHLKSEHETGFSARTFDTLVTVPFLERHSLPKSVESHWMTRTFSFENAWTRDVALKTQPKHVGVDLIEIVNSLEELAPKERPRVAKQLASIVLTRLVEERNKSRIPCERPRNLTVSGVVSLLSEMLQRGYTSGAPRLPQLMIYAVYAAIVDSGAGRYDGMELEPLGRLRSADRKSGTVGDVVVTDPQGRPFEAVEVKFEREITDMIVAEAADKVKHADVKRYLILSTVGIKPSEAAMIDARVANFRRSNGCEIIVNGVLETLKYYIRLLPDPFDFTQRFVRLLESDPDLGYEHRVAWNELVQQAGAEAETPISSVDRAVTFVSERTSDDF